MKTSEIENVLLGHTSLESFCLLYKEEMERVFSRKDGAIVSADLRLSWDSDGVVVTDSQIKNIQKSSNNDCIYFFANLIILSDFNYDSEETQDIVYSLAE